jgi:hypothetical protein
MTSSSLATTTATFPGALPTTFILGSAFGKFFPHFGDFLEATQGYSGVIFFLPVSRGTRFFHRVTHGCEHIGQWGRSTKVET